MQQLPQLQFAPLLNLVMPRLHYLLVPLIALGVTVGITFSVIAARETWNAMWVAAAGFTVAIAGASYLFRG